MPVTQKLKQEAKGFVQSYKGPFHSLNDTMRILMMVVVAGLLFYPDFTMLRIVQYVLGIQVALSLISHVTRKMLFPKVDIDVFFEKSKEEPMSAAIAILAVSMVLATLIFVSGHLFGGVGQ